MKISLQIILVCAIVGIILYFTIFSVPKIKVTNVDYNTRTADIKIGKKLINYNYEKGMVYEVGKVSPLYTASIEAYEGTDGLNARSTISIYKNGALRGTESIYFV